MSGYGGSGPQGGISILTPAYNRNVANTVLDMASLNAGTTLEFFRVTGPQQLIFKYLNFTWYFFLSGGSNTQQSSALPGSLGGSISAYNQTINYRVTSPPPRGCVVQQIPPPPNTSRVNVFNVIENVTGLNISLTLAWCPFFGIPPTIMQVGGGAVAAPITLKILFCRVIPELRSPGTPLSSGAPIYETRSMKKRFKPVAGVNPLDAGVAMPFKRYNGQQDIVVTNLATNQFFIIEVDYGIITDGGGYIGVVSPTANCLLQGTVNCTAVTSSATFQVATPVTITVTEPATGRVYAFFFDPTTLPRFPPPPTIKLVSGPALGNVTLEVATVYRYFSTI